MKKIISTLALSTMLAGGLSAASEPKKDACCMFVGALRRAQENIPGVIEARKFLLPLANLDKCERRIVQFLLHRICRDEYSMLEVATFVKEIRSKLRLVPTTVVLDRPEWAMNPRACRVVEIRANPLPLSFLKHKGVNLEDSQVLNDILEAIESGDLYESDLYTLENDDCRKYPRSNIDFETPDS